jgi:hypothetical protein
LGWVAALSLTACGAPGTTQVLEQNGPRAPRFVLQGQCAPSAVSAAATVEERTSTCVKQLGAPTLVDTAADFDALFDATCEKPAIDFTQHRVLVVPARGANEWFVFPNFLNARTDALEVGLVIRPQGAQPPDALVLLPRTPEAVELRWCHSVCVENCDVAIP